MTNEIIKAAERMPVLDGGIDPGAQAEELAQLPVGGVPTYRKRLIVRALEDAAMDHIDNPEHAGRYGSTIMAYGKGIRDDVVFNVNLQSEERKIETKKASHASPRLSPQERERLITKLAHIFGKDPQLP